MTFAKYTLGILFSSTLSLSAAMILPEGKSVEVAPLSYNYTVVQNFENSVAESTHGANGSIKEDENVTHNVHTSGFGYFNYHATGSAEATKKRDNTYTDYKETQKYTSSTSNDTVIVEKIMYSDKMTGVIETALNDAGLEMSKSGDYLLTGSIKAMRTGKPRLVPDGTNARYAVSSTTTIHINIADKKGKKVLFAKTFTGTGQQTFNVNDPIPVEETVDASVEDLVAQITEALSGKKRSAAVDYQDSPGKRLVD